MNTITCYISTVKIGNTGAYGVHMYMGEAHDKPTSGPKQHTPLKQGYLPTSCIKSGLKDKQLADDIFHAYKIDVNKDKEHIDVLKEQFIKITKYINISNYNTESDLKERLEVEALIDTLSTIKNLIDKNGQSLVYINFNSKYLHDILFSKDARKKNSKINDLLDDIDNKVLNYNIAIEGSIGYEAASIVALGGIANKILNKGRLYREYNPLGYWNPKTDKHPLLSFKRLYFNTLEANDNTYYLGNPVHSESNLGKKISSTGYGVLKLSKPIDKIKEIRALYQRVEPKSANMVIVYNDALYSPGAIFGYSILGPSMFNIKQTPNGNYHVVFKDLLIAAKLEMPTLIMQAIDYFNILEDVLNNINNKDNNFKMQTFDIIDEFYDKIKDNSYRLKSDFKVGIFKKKITIPFKGKTIINLILGTDMPDRNNLKRLNNIIKEMRLAVFTFPGSVTRYGVYIKLINGDEALYSNITTNNILK